MLGPFPLHVFPSMHTTAISIILRSHDPIVILLASLERRLPLTNTFPWQSALARLHGGYRRIHLSPRSLKSIFTDSQSSRSCCEKPRGAPLKRCPPPTHGMRVGTQSLSCHVCLHPWLAFLWKWQSTTVNKLLGWNPSVVLRLQLVLLSHGSVLTPCMKQHVPTRRNSRP